MAKILDINGNPLEQAQLVESQTAQIAALRCTFENHPTRGLTPAKLARIMENAERGDMVAQSEMFMDFEEKDAHIFAEMSKRKRAMLTLDWSIKPPRNASKAEAADAEYVEEVLRDFHDLEDLMLDALDGIGHGFACIELEWELSGREWLIKRADHRPQTWFTTAREDRNELRLRDNSVEGVPLWPFGWVTHLHRAKSGYIARSGLHRVLAWPFLLKNYSVRDLAEFLEIYGLPLRMGTYPAGANDTEKRTLLAAVTAIGHAAAGIMPEGMAIEIKEAAKGQSDPFVAMIEWAEKSQSKAILGGTLTSQSDGQSSTNALGNVHNEVRHDLLVSDARQLEGTFTRDLVYSILALNRGVRDLRRLPRFVFDTGEAEDLKLFSEALPPLVNAGMQIPVEWAHDKLRIPKPEKGEVVLQPANVSAPTDTSPGNAAATRAALKAGDANAAEGDEFDALGDEMASEWENVTAPLFAPFEQLAATCASLQEFRDRLPEAVAGMDAAALAGLIAEGDFAANVWGRVSGE